MNKYVEKQSEDFVPAAAKVQKIIKTAMRVKARFR